MLSEGYFLRSSVSGLRPVPKFYSNIQQINLHQHRQMAIIPHTAI
jgi:hypothetical protein